MTERLTVTLAYDQRQALAELGRKMRVSSATVIRWAVDEYLATHLTEMKAKDRPRKRRDQR